MPMTTAARTGWRTGFLKSLRPHKLQLLIGLTSWPCAEFRDRVTGGDPLGNVTKERGKGRPAGQGGGEVGLLGRRLAEHFKAQLKLRSLLQMQMGNCILNMPNI